MRGDLLFSYEDEPLVTPYGTFAVEVFGLGGQEVLVLRCGPIPGTVERVLCRIQSECFSHIFLDRSCDCAEQVDDAMQRMQQAGAGLLIYLKQEGMGQGIAGKLSGDLRDWRSYEPAAEILDNYGVTSIRLLTLDKRKAAHLRAAGVDVELDAWQDPPPIFELGERVQRTVQQVRSGSAYPYVEPRRHAPRILVLGDLNMDQVRPGADPVVAGSAFNAALAFKKAETMTPVLFGKVGRDAAGHEVRRAIQENGIHSLLGTHDEKATGAVKVTETADQSAPFQYEWDKRDNANDYDASNLRQAIALADIGSGDWAFLSSYLFVQKFFDVGEVNEILRIVSDTSAKLVLDLTRKSLARDVLDDCGVSDFGADELTACLDGVKIHTILGEVGTFSSLGLTPSLARPNRDRCLDIARFFGARCVVCRFIEGGSRRQLVGYLTGADIVMLDEQVMRGRPLIGLSDEMLAEALRTIHTHESRQAGALDEPS